jgi:hypothetical protein
MFLLVNFPFLVLNISTDRDLESLIREIFIVHASFLSSACCTNLDSVGDTDEASNSGEIKKNLVSNASKLVLIFNSQSFTNIMFGAKSSQSKSNPCTGMNLSFYQTFTDVFLRSVRIVIMSLLVNDGLYTATI